VALQYVAECQSRTHVPKKKAHPLDPDFRSNLRAYRLPEGRFDSIQNPRLRNSELDAILIVDPLDRTSSGASLRQAVTS
jgi:hypothetical protein